MILCLATLQSLRTNTLKVTFIYFPILDVLIPPKMKNKCSNNINRLYFRKNNRPP